MVAKILFASVKGFLYSSLFIIPWVTEAVVVSVYINNPYCQFVVLACGILLTILSTFNSGLLGLGRHTGKLMYATLNDHLFWGIWSAIHGVCFIVPWIIINLSMSWVLVDKGVISWYTHLFCYTPILLGIVAQCSTCLTRDSSADNIIREVASPVDQEIDDINVCTFKELTQTEQVIAVFGSIVLSFGLWITEVVIIVNYCSNENLPLFLIIISSILMCVVAFPSVILGFGSTELFNSGWLNFGRGVAPKRYMYVGLCAAAILTPWMFVNMITLWIIVINRDMTLKWYVQLMCHMPVLICIPFFFAGRSIKDSIRRQIHITPNDVYSPVSEIEPMHSKKNICDDVTTDVCTAET